MKQSLQDVRDVLTAVTLQSINSLAADSLSQVTDVNVDLVKRRTKKSFLTFSIISSTDSLTMSLFQKKRLQEVLQVFQEFLICMKTIRSGIHFSQSSDTELYSHLSQATSFTNQVLNQFHLSQSVILQSLHMVISCGLLSRELNLSSIHVYLMSITNMKALTTIITALSLLHMLRTSRIMQKNLSQKIQISEILSCHLKVRRRYQKDSLRNSHHTFLPQRLSLLSKPDGMK